MEDIKQLQVMETIAKVMDEVGNTLEAEGRSMQDGDEFAYILNDGIVIVSLEGTEMNIKVIAGEIQKLDLNLNLVEMGKGEDDLQKLIDGTKKAEELEGQVTIEDIEGNTTTNE